MGSKGFLDFIDDYEKGLDDYIRKEEEVVEESVEPEVKVIPKPVQKSVPKKVVKESSEKFSFCTSCGQKILQMDAKFCPHCGKPTVRSTDGKNVSKNSPKVSEDIDYASALMDDETPMEQSRLLEYLSKNPVRSPIEEAVRQSQNMSVPHQTGFSDTASHAMDLLDETPEVGTVQLLEMPDFSKFMPKPKEEIKENVAPSAPMIPPITNVDSDIQQQMQSLGLL